MDRMPNSSWPRRIAGCTRRSGPTAFIRRRPSRPGTPSGRPRFTEPEKSNEVAALMIGDHASLHRRYRGQLLDSSVPEAGGTNRIEQRVWGVGSGTNPDPLPTTYSHLSLDIFAIYSLS